MLWTCYNHLYIEKKTVLSAPICLVLYVDNDGIVGIV